MVTRVLIVDDSAVVRKSITKVLAQAYDVEVVGHAPDPFIARDKILSLKPDVVLLDIEMPRMDGITFLGKIMKHYPLPVIIISSLTPKSGAMAMRALEAGAFDVLCKPDSARSIGSIGNAILDSVRAAGLSKPRLAASIASSSGGARIEPMVAARRRVIAIGASTGGTEATRAIMERFPKETPGILIVQHISKSFAGTYARRLNEVCSMEVREVQDGDRVEQGVALVAQGDQHMILCRDTAGYYVQSFDGPKVHFQRPSIDVLFKSVARQAAPDSVGVLLTGMGKDGAEGLLAMRDKGARTIAQDEETSTVYGMPRVAYEMGAVEKVQPLGRIAHETLRACA